ncbi:MAG: hypothetical protein FD180_4957 [Planctomycetota bacterium]|nr:MAG: hypothetical protein FD180_4957 [Planctomycetota bacterium]
MTDDSFDFECPCGARLEAPSSFEGRRLRCPACLAIVRAERMQAPESVLVDPLPVSTPPRVDPDRAVPYVAFEQPPEPPFSMGVCGRVWRDFMVPVTLTWFTLLAVVLWTGDDMGATPARVMFFAYTAGFFYAGARLPRHMGVSLTDSLL